jgi:PAS domain-containing protein
MRALEGAGAYAAAVAAITAATAARWLLDPALGDHSLFLTYYPAVVVIAWLATSLPAAATLLLGAAAADFFFVPPRYVLAPHWPLTEHQVALALYLFTGGVIIAICHALHAAERRAARQREELQVTLSSTGDGVITTDAEGRVSSMNPVAAALTGWSPAEALGRPLPEVFPHPQRRNPAAAGEPGDERAGATPHRRARQSHRSHLERRRRAPDRRQRRADPRSRRQSSRCRADLSRRQRAQAGGQDACAPGGDRGLLP